MAFSDWSVFNAGDVTMTQTSLDPLVGLGSLRMSAGGVSSNNTAVLIPNTLPHGFNQGRLESLFRVQSNNATGIKYFGLISNISSEADPLGVANGYGMIGEIAGGSTWNTLRLVKWSGGSGISTTFTTLDSFTIGTPVDVGDTFAFQFDWISDVAEFGGTKLICRFQEASNFTGIPAVIDYVDAILPLITSQAEGFMVGANTAGSSIVVNADSSSLYEIT